MNPASLVTTLKEFIRRSKRVSLVLIGDMLRFDLFKQASAMAYVTLLSIVPSLAIVFVLLSLFAPLFAGETDLTGIVKDFILGHLTSASGVKAGEVLDQIIGNLNLAQMGVTGFLGFLVTLILLLRNIEIVFNRIWMVEKKRPIFVRFIYFWTFVTLGFFLASLAVGLVSGYKIKQYFDLEQNLGELSSPFLLSHLPSLLAEFIGFFFLYRLVPNTRVSYRASAVGAITAAITFQLSSAAFGLYVKQFANYQSLYGAIGILPVFLIWLYLGWIVILLAGVIAWRVDQGWPRDETHGRDAEGDPFRAMRSRSLLPLLCLLMAHRQFVEGKGSLSGQEIQANLKYPKDWIVESLNFLVAKKLLIAVSKSQQHANEQSGILESTFLPASPAQSINIATIRSQLIQPVSEWLPQTTGRLTQSYTKWLEVILDQASPQNLSLDKILV